MTLETDWKFKLQERDDTRTKRLNEILTHLRELGIEDVAELEASLTAINAALALKAPLASPALTGLPTITNNDPTRGIFLSLVNVDDDNGTLIHLGQAAGSWSFGFKPAADRFSFYRGRSVSADGTEVAWLDWTTTAFSIATGWTYRINGVQVVGARSTGWAAMTGTAIKTTIATYTAPVISNPPTQAEVQAIANAVQAISQRMKAYDDALFAATGHGLIGT